MKILLTTIIITLNAFSLSSQVASIDTTKMVSKPWYIAATETTAINVIVNRFDLYVLAAEWADVSPTSWKRNFERGFLSDGDSFNTNFFAHPYHGSLYFNSARSLGYSYWQSMPYVLGGSLMWEFLGETEPPSEIDINTTTLGGIYLGEMTNRLSRALLYDDGIRSYKFIRNFGALALNPIGQINSWLYEDVNASFRGKNKKKFPIRSQLSSGISIPIREIERVDALGRANIHFAMIYGDLFSSGVFKPFDSFVLKSWIDLGSRKAEKQFYMNISSNAKIFRFLINDNSAFSISQHYDYMENQIFKTGMLGITADYTIRKNFGSWGFVGTANLGLIPFGSSNSEIVDYLNETVDEEFYKEYVYGRGLISKLEYIIYTNKFGRLTSSYSHWYLNTENYTQGIENTSVLQVKYFYPISKSLNIGLELLNYTRNARYEEIPQFENIDENYLEMKLLVAKSF